MRRRKNCEPPCQRSELALVELSKHTRGEVALVYPNAYPLAIANLGFNRVFEIFTRFGFEVHRFVYDPSKRRLSSLDGRKWLEDLDVWLVSIHFESDLLNVLEILSEVRIPFSPEQRRSRHPVIVAGGSLTYFMALPLTDIFDVVYKGDLEPNAERLVEAVLNGKGLGRDRMVESLAEVPSVVTRLDDGEPEVALWNGKGFARSVFLSDMGSFGYRFLVEVERGCRRACRFCVVGYRMKPARYADLHWILGTLEEALRFTNKVGLVGPTVLDHPEIDEIAEYLHERDVDVSFSSMRADRITDVVMRALAKHQRGFTIAPEGGSQKVRNFLGKGINETHIMRAIRLGAEHGLKRIKMYFIYGTPVEEEEDLEEIVRLAREAKRFYRDVRVSLNPLIPKPGTPFEGMEMLDRKELKRRERMLRKRLTEIGVKSEFESIKGSLFQYRVSNARKGELLESLMEYAGINR